MRDPGCLIEGNGGGATISQAPNLWQTCTPQSLHKQRAFNAYVSAMLSI